MPTAALASTRRTGTGISGVFTDGYMGASRHKEATEVLQRLAHDPSLVSRAMVEDEPRYKRPNGMATAPRTIAPAWFPGAGRVSMCGRLRRG